VKGGQPEKVAPLLSVCTWGLKTWSCNLVLASTNSIGLFAYDSSNHVRVKGEH